MGGAEDGVAAVGATRARPAGAEAGGAGARAGVDSKDCCGAALFSVAVDTDASGLARIVVVSMVGSSSPAAASKLLCESDACCRGGLTAGLDGGGDGDDEEEAPEMTCTKITSC